MKRPRRQRFEAFRAALKAALNRQHPLVGGHLSGKRTEGLGWAALAPGTG